MDPKTKKLLIGSGVVLVLGLALPVTNLLTKGPSGTALSQRAESDATAKAAAAALESKCGSCHVTGVAPPFYAGLPIASSLIHKDMASGMRDMDLVADVYTETATPPNEAALAKIEYVLQRDEMPPARFLALHWNGGLSATEKKSVESWIASSRAHHAVPGTPDAMKASVLRPLPTKVEVDARKAELGRKLYHDNRLSGDDTLSCASCHDLKRGGTDNAKVSTGIRGQLGGINAPTTFNSAYQVKQFWDGRAATLEDQAGGPPNNPVEMGSNWAQIIKKLAQDEALTAEFTAAYPDGWSDKNITHAIAEFERTLVTPNSPFDRFLGGDAAALGPDEKKGHELFVSKGCATCHVGELLGGRSFELMGRRADYFAARGAITEADNGRFNATKNEADKQHFKVPTLRNIARTQPYFHDGSAANLNEAVRAMAKYESGWQPSDAEVAAMVKFLEALTGEYDGKAL